MMLFFWSSLFTKALVFTVSRLVGSLKAFESTLHLVFLARFTGLSVALSSSHDGAAKSIWGSGLASCRLPASEISRCCPLIGHFSSLGLR